MVTTARRAFLKALDAPAVETAIRRAEAGTTGELRVSIAGYFRGQPRRLAERAFQRLGMDATRHRNGVLIFIAPARRQVVVLGDAGIHGHVGDEFWQQIATDLSAAARSGQVNEGLLRAIARIGDELARHFPAGSSPNPNELPDTIDVPR